MKFSDFSQRLLRFLRLQDTAGGLEISDTALSYAYLHGSKWQRHAVPLAQGIIEGGEVKDLSAYTVALSLLHSQITHGVVGKRVPAALSLSSYHIYSQIIKIPDLPATELATALSLNVSMMVPKDYEVYTSTQIVHRDENESSVEALAAFMPRALVDVHNGALVAAGFLPVVLEWKSLSLARYLRTYVPLATTTPVSLLFSIDDRGITVSVLRVGVLYFDYILLWRDVIGDSKTITREMLSSAISDTLFKVTSYVRGRLPESISQIFLFAGNLQSVATEIISSTTTIPLAPVEVSQDPQNFPWIIAMGAGVRWMGGQDTHEINVIGAEVDAEVRTVQLINFLRLWQFVVPVLLIVVLAIAMVQDIYTIKTKNQIVQKYVDSVNPSIREQLRAYTASAAEFNALAHFVSATGVGRTLFSPVMSRVFQEASLRSVVISSYSQSGSNLTIQASAHSQEDALAFQKTLIGIPQFSAVMFPLNAVRTIPYGISFTISLSINPAN